MCKPNQCDPGDAEKIYPKIVKSINHCMQREFNKNVIEKITIPNNCVDYPENKVTEPTVDIHTKPFATNVE